MALYTAQIQSWLFASEGGYVNHPKDPGGATNYGVTHEVLAAWRGKPVTRDDVRNMPKSEAAAIMKAQYWDKIMGDALPAGLDYATFDYAVNSGVSRAVKDLQRCLGKLYTGTIDGIMGTMTLDAVRKINNVAGLIQDLCERRYAFVKRLKTFSTFGKGWTRRIMGNVIGAQPGEDIGVIDRASLLARGRTPESIPAPTTVAPAKAAPEPDTVMDALKKPEMIGVGLSGAGGVVAALANNPILSAALAVVIVGAAGLAAFYFIRRMRAADPT